MEVTYIYIMVIYIYISKNIRDLVYNHDISCYLPKNHSKQGFPTINAWCILPHTIYYVTTQTCIVVVHWRCQTGLPNKGLVRDLHDWKMTAWCCRGQNLGTLQTYGYQYRHQLTIGLSFACQNRWRFPLDKKTNNEKLQSGSEIGLCSPIQVQMYPPSDIHKPMPRLSVKTVTYRLWAPLCIMRSEPNQPQGEPLL
jgi:hypothetical protein